MKNVLIILGCLGGILCLVDYLCQGIRGAHNIFMKHMKYKRCYEAHKEEEEIVPKIGFKTEAEKKEIEAKLQNMRKNRV